MFNLTLENFTGPLDVLLGLIEEKKLPIHEVSLATVADSFLQYVQTYAQSRPNLLTLMNQVPINFEHAGHHIRITRPTGGDSAVLELVQVIAEALGARVGD